MPPKRLATAFRTPLNAFARIRLQCDFRGNCTLGLNFNSQSFVDALCIPFKGAVNASFTFAGFDYLTFILLLFSFSETQRELAKTMLSIQL